MKRCIVLWCAGLLLAGLVVGLVAGGCGSARQAVLPGARSDTTLTAGTPLARFEDARAVSTDPAGTVYVADAGQGVIVRLPPEEGQEEVLGGPGGDAGEFDEPADVDPTNGLVLVVADAGNSRIQRFSEEFQHLETLPVGRGYAAAGQRPARPVYDTRSDDTNDLGGGRPIAVVETGASETFALDAAEGHVLKWEDQRKTVRVIGGFGDGAGALRDPVDLAAGPDGLLYVADPGRGAVMTYDRFGSFLAARAAGRVDSARAVATDAAGRLYVARPASVLIFDREGRLLRRARLRLDAPVVDVAPSGRWLYVLTARRLHRFPRP